MFKSYRKSTGLTQVQAAEVLGVNQPAISAWESRQRRGSDEAQAELVERLRAALDAVTAHEAEAEEAQADHASEV